MGTLVKRDNKIIADLVKNGERAIIARGGDGGFGNATRIDNRPVSSAACCFSSGAAGVLATS